MQTAAFSPDGTRIVTASGDKTARIWDAASGAERAVPRGHENWVQTAAFSPDGTRIVTASRDKTARIWEAKQPELADLIAFARVTRFRVLTGPERRELYLPVSTATTIADATERARVKMQVANTPSRLPIEVLHCQVLATELYEAAGDQDQAQMARDKRAALAWRLPVPDVAKVYRDCLRELFALGAIATLYGLDTMQREQEAGAPSPRS